MKSWDAELEQMRTEVSCAVLLERLPSPWHLDKKESTRRCLKYRRGAGEILLITHEGRGWWDPGITAKGDVFNLVQFLDPSLSFSEVRSVLRPFIGQAPSFPEHETVREKQRPDIPFATRWERRRFPRRESLTWRYLTETRRLPAPVVAAAISAGILREGPYASAWFAHQNTEGELTGIEMRGPDYRGFSPGGEKTLFRLPGWLRTSTVPTSRLVVAEAPIDAMSVAAIERLRADTLYAATAGGMGPGTITALKCQLLVLAKQEGAEIVIATDNDAAGHAYAARLADIAAPLHVKISRLLPISGAKDWNEVLQRRTAA